MNDRNLPPHDLLVQRFEELCRAAPCDENLPTAEAFLSTLPGGLQDTLPNVDQTRLRTALAQIRERFASHPPDSGERTVPDDKTVTTSRTVLMSGDEADHVEAVCGEWKERANVGFSFLRCHGPDQQITREARPGSADGKRPRKHLTQSGCSAGRLRWIERA